VLFGIYLLIGLGAHLLAFRIRETYGKNIHEGRTFTVRLLGSNITLRA